MRAGLNSIIWEQYTYRAPYLLRSRKGEAPINTHPRAGHAQRTFAYPATVHQTCTEKREGGVELTNYFLVERRLRLLLDDYGGAARAGLRGSYIGK